MGLRIGISGNDLYKSGIKQAENLGVKIKKEEVLHIEKIDDYFEVTTSVEKYESKTVIIATGNKKIRPNIKGIEEFEGKGISYCAVCDGFFYRGKKVAIIGNGKFAVNEANVLKNIANEITILTNGLEMNANTSLKINNKKIKEIKGGLRVQEIEFEDNSVLEVDGVFIALGEAGGVDFAKKMGVLTNKDSIVVDDKMQTNIEGLFSCGNSNGGLLQVCKAVYEGAVAGLSAVSYIKNINEK